MSDGTLRSPVAQEVADAHEIPDLSLPLIGDRAEQFPGEHWFEHPSLCRLCRQPTAWSCQNPSTI